MVVSRSGAGSLSTPRPNYVNPPTRGPAVQAISVVFAVLTTLSQALRLYMRGRIKRQFGLDDVFATFATLLINATLVIQVVLTVVFHLNRHTRDIPPHDRYVIDRVTFVYDIIFAEAACQCKLSLLFFVHKMIGTARHGSLCVHYVCLLTLIVVVAICQVLFVFLSCIECRPLKAAWDPHPTYPYRCFNISMFLSITGVINTLTDFLCTMLPALIVLKLQIPLRKRLSIASLFLVGILVNIASALRIYYCYIELKTADLWNSMPSSICSNLELGLGLLCINIPIIYAPVARWGTRVVAHARSVASDDNNNYRVFTDTNSYGHSWRPNMLASVDHHFKNGASITHETGVDMGAIEAFPTG